MLFNKYRPRHVQLKPLRTVYRATGDSKVNKQWILPRSSVRKKVTLPSNIVKVYTVYKAKIKRRA